MRSMPAVCARIDSTWCKAFRLMEFAFWQGSLRRGSSACPSLAAIATSADLLASAAPPDGQFAVLDAAIELSASIGRICSESTLPFVGVDMLSRIAQVRFVSQTSIGITSRGRTTCETVLGPATASHSRRRRCLVFLDATVLPTSVQNIGQVLRQRAAGHDIIVILTGKTDMCFPMGELGYERAAEHAERLQLLELPFVKRWMAGYPCEPHRKVESLPIGLKWTWHLAPMGHDDVSEFRSLHLSRYAGVKERLVSLWHEVRDGLIPRKLLLNSYTVATTDRPRLRRYTGLRRRLVQVITERFGDRVTSQPVNVSALYEVTEQHALVMAPPGNGVDTHRFWESILAGSLPIVAADVPVGDLYRGIPHIALGVLEDVTPSMLEQALVRFSRESRPDDWQLRKLYHMWFLVRAHCLANTPEVVDLGVCVGELAEHMP